MDEPTRIREIYDRLIRTRDAQHWEPTSLSHFQGQPFKALIASMLSAQTREENTTAAMKKHVCKGSIAGRMYC